MSANYHALKKMKTASVGTIIPWAGDTVPDGWLACNGQTLPARQYPLLASILGTSYGGTITGAFPNYNELDSFLMPQLNDRVLVDYDNAMFGNVAATALTGTGTITASTGTTTITGVGTSFNSELKVGTPLFNSANAEIGIVASIASNTSLTLTANSKVNVAAGGTFKYNNLWVQSPDAGGVMTQYVQGAGVSSNYRTINAQTDINFQLQSTNNFAGRIRNFSLNDAAYNAAYYVFPRKLGINHWPSHTHPGNFETAVVDGPNAEVVSKFNSAGCCEENNKERTISGELDTWTAGGGGWQAAAYVTTSGNNADQSVVYMDGHKMYQANPADPTVNKVGDIFPMPCYIGLFPPKVNDNPTEQGENYLGRRIYYSQMPANYVSNTYVNQGPTTPYTSIAAYGFTRPTFPTTLNRNVEQFTDNTLTGHHHTTFEVSMNKGSLRIPGNISVNNVQSGAGANALTPQNLPDVLSINVTNSTASVSVLYIIRAY